jgi:hypothetical protein
LQAAPAELGTRKTDVDGKLALAPKSSASYARPNISRSLSISKLESAKQNISSKRLKFLGDGSVYIFKTKI